MRSSAVTGLGAGTCIQEDEDDDAGTRYGRASFALGTRKVKGGRWVSDPPGASLAAASPCAGRDLGRMPLREPRRPARWPLHVNIF